MHEMGFHQERPHRSSIQPNELSLNGTKNFTLHRGNVLKMEKGKL